jgi:hypothetical protein
MRKLFKIFLIVTSILLVLIIAIIAIYTAPFWYKKFVTYPRLEKQRAEIWAQYKKPDQHINLTDYKGILHAHTYWSHDSRGTIKEILPAAKKANLDFLFFSDHPHAKLDTFPRSYSGVYDGIIIEPGSEKGGLIVCPMDTVVLDWSVNQDDLIKNVVDNGGLAMYLHTEDPHNWGNPDYQGMEIYNIHTDILDGEDLFSLIVNFAVNGKKYRHWAFREIYDDQTEILARWDSLNTVRRIVGFGAPDAHNNQNVRARYLDNGDVEWVGPDANTIKTGKPGILEKILLGDSDEAGWAFRFETDSYYGSFNFVNTHVFTDTLSNVAIKNNLVQGNAFVSFESLANATGFQYFAVDEKNNLSAIMGDSCLVKNAKSVKVVSPFPVKIEIFKNGPLMEFIENVYSHKFETKGPGNYRIVASLKFDKKWTPWVFTNPIYIYQAEKEMML